mmetsp:Transcript_6315/g.15634  ORF Transcript_6315/g.15634 Transcript_6315/m.15634 type:complete len:903 (+) Transcript_6315:2560-5268(+)
MDTKQFVDICGIRLSTDPEVEVDAIVHEVNTIAGERIDRQRKSIRQQYTIASGKRVFRDIVRVVVVVFGGGITGIGLHVVQREEGWIHERLGLVQPHLVDVEKGLQSLVGMHVRSSTESNVLHQRQGVEREELQRRRQRVVLGLVGLGCLRHGVSGNRPDVPSLCGPDQIHARLLQSHAGIVQGCLERNVDRLSRQEIAGSKDVHPGDQFGGESGGRECLGHDPNATLSLTIGVEKSGLDRDVVAGEIFSVVCQVKAKDGIGVHVGKRHQIRSPNEKVSVVVGDLHSLCNAGSHNGLERRVGGKGLVESFLESWSVLFEVEHNVGVERSRRVLGQVSQRRHVDVGVREQEHVHADLLATEFHGRVLVPFGVPPQDLHFGARSHQGRVLSRFEGTVAQVGLDRLEDQHFATDLLHDRKGGFERGSQTRLRGHRALDKHFREAVQERIHHRPRFLQVDQQTVRERNKELLQRRHHQHLGLLQIRGQVEVVDRVVKGDESDLRPPPTGEIVQAALDGVGRAFQHAAVDRLRTHVEHKEIRGLLRRPDHVLGGGDEFHDALRELGTVEPVRSESVVVQVAKVGGRGVVYLRTNVAPPAPAVVDPVHKGVDVGATPLAPNDPGTSRLYRGHFVLALGSRGSQRADDTTEWHLGLNRNVVGGGDFVARHAEEAVRYGNVEINVFLVHVLLLGRHRHRHTRCHSRCHASRSGLLRCSSDRTASMHHRHRRRGGCSDRTRGSRCREVSRCRGLELASRWTGWWWRSAWGTTKGGWWWRSGGAWWRRLEGHVRHSLVQILHATTGRAWRGSESTAGSGRRGSPKAAGSGRRCESTSRWRWRRCKSAAGASRWRRRPEFVVVVGRRWWWGWETHVRFDSIRFEVRLVKLRSDPKQNVRQLIHTPGASRCRGR